MDTVSLVLVDRRAAAAGLDRTLGCSAAAHVALVAFVALVPADWLRGRREASDAVVTFQLDGAVGPRDGGMTAMPARPVQQVRELEAKKAIEPARPPAARQPEMIEPTTVAPNRREAPVKTSAQEPRSKTPTDGAARQDGTAVADTKSKSTSLGLTSGGGGTGAQLDVGDFCPEYIVTMQDLINRNWTSKQDTAGTTVIKFTIERDGRLTHLSLFRSSGQRALDFAAERALLLTKQLPPLPTEFTQQSLPVRLYFEFAR